MKLPKLHLRDWFWLALVLGLAIGWFRDRRTLEGLAMAAEVLMISHAAGEQKINEAEALKDAYQDRLSEFGDFTHQKVGPLEYDIVPVIDPPAQ